MKTVYAKNPAVIVLESAGQQPAHEGNKVVVEVTVILPATDDGWVAEPLHFGSKVRLFGQSLSSFWGELGEMGRQRQERFSGATWSSAKGKAVRYVNDELRYLNTALTKRRKALSDAGDWE